MLKNKKLIIITILSSSLLLGACTNVEFLNDSGKIKISDIQYDSNNNESSNDMLYSIADINNNLKSFYVNYHLEIDNLVTTRDKNSYFNNMDKELITFNESLEQSYSQIKNLYNSNSITEEDKVLFENLKKSIDKYIDGVNRVNNYIDTTKFNQKIINEMNKENEKDLLEYENIKQTILKQIK